MLPHSIEKISRSSALGPRIRRVDVEAEADAEGDAYLRVSLEFDHTDDLEWDNVEPLVRSIEDAVAWSMIASPAYILPMRLSGEL